MQMKTTNLKISIITCSYNSEKNIERSIQSVLTQNYTNWEHIIIDGGSTDTTLRILKKYPHLKWVSKKNKGQADAMNKGFKLSKGNIIVYLNADDYFFPKAFSSVINEFKNGAKFVVGDVFVKSSRLKAEFLNIPKTTLKEMLRHWEPNAFSINPLGYFYIRDIQRKFPFNVNNVYSRDLEFLLEVVSKYTFTKIDLTLGCFEDKADTKTAISQSRLDYWQTNNFLYLEKYLKIFTNEEKIQYFRDRRNGYCHLQSRMNASGNKSIVLLNSTDMPLISVIIPTYNDSKHMCSAIDSVLNQGCVNIEIIVIDDASTDNTKKILIKKYSKNTRVRLYFQNKNNHQGYQRNFGIQKSRGKYLFFLDSDDWIAKGALIHLISIAEEYSCDVVACGINKISDNNKISLYHGVDMCSSGGIEGLNYFADYKISAALWNKLYRRDFLINNSIFFVTSYEHEDVLFSRDVIFKCKRYISISTPYYNYLNRSGSTLNAKKNVRYLRSYLNFYINMCEFFRENNLKDDYVTTNLKLNLIRSHCFNIVAPYLFEYIATRTKEEFEKELLEACTQEIGVYGYSLAEFTISLLNVRSSIVMDKKFNIIRYIYDLIPFSFVKSFLKKIYLRKINRHIKL